MVTATQLGYTTGIFLIVPLGDTINRRYLIPTLIFLCSLALFATGLSSTYNIALITLAAVGLTSVIGQLLIPLAGDLADDLQRILLVPEPITHLYMDLISAIVGRNLAAIERIVGPAEKKEFIFDSKGLTCEKKYFLHETITIIFIRGVADWIKVINQA